MDELSVPPPLPPQLPSRAKPSHRGGGKEAPPVIEVNLRRSTLIVRRRDFAGAAKRLLAWLLILVFGGYTAYSLLFGTKGAISSPSSSTARTLSPDELQQQEQVAIGSEQLKRVLDEGQSVRALCDTLDSDLKRWDTEIQSLWTDDTGRLIASDQGTMLVFEAQTKEPRPTSADADALRSRLGALLTPVQSAWDVQQWSYRPPVEISALLKNLKGEINARLKQVNEPRLHIAMLVANAKSRGKRADMPLKDALNDYHSRQATEWADSEAEIRKKIEQEYSVKIKKQAEDAERAKQEAKLDLDRQTQKLERQKLETEAANADAAAKHEVLMQKAKTSEIRNLLSFFFTPGYSQPGNIITAEKRPVSLSKLESFGCLQQSYDGQRRLFDVLSFTPDKERPIWKLNPSYGNQPANVRDKVIEIQKALIELGPTLVELKLLDP